ncbi:MAG: hypothetical protein IJS62_07010 [Bacteroidales bacterium]|nr:hypothetical protein [Bacteroidales bacterium]
MKKILVFAAAAALLSVSCNREASTPSVGTVTRTFTVNAPGEGEDATPGRTYLDGATAVLWSASDKINVIAANSGNQYTFTLKSGEGTASATFEGALLEDDAEETEFYAVYPNVAVKPTEWSKGLIALNTAVSDTQTAVPGGYDPDFGIMTAVSDNGTLSFRHGMAFFKITVGTKGVYAVTVETSNTRFGGRPVYVAETGVTSSVESASGRTKATIKAESGTLAKDGVYYIPVTCKHNASIKNLTVTYYFDEEMTEASSLTTDKKKDETLEEGKVYDLGCPPISGDPVISTDNVAIKADATGGTVEYSLVRPVAGGTVSIALDAEYENTIGNLSFGTPADGSVSFTCDENTESGVKTAKFILTYTYNTDETVTAEAYISQASAGGEATPVHTYTLYANGTKHANILQTADGGEGTYFSLSEKVSGVSLSGYTGYPFTQPAADNTVKDFAYGIKMNGDAVGTGFTTSSTLTSTLTLYLVNKNTGTANFQLVPEGGTAVNYPCEQGVVSKHVITLAKGTAYTFARSGEHALIYAIVNEYED